MSRVFIIQRHYRRDRVSGERIPFDVTPAEEFGELVYLLEDDANPHNPGPVIRRLMEALGDYSDDDFLLLIGNPCLIGWATALAAGYNDGRIRLLQYDRHNRRYIPVQSDLPLFR